MKGYGTHSTGRLALGGAPGMTLPIGDAIACRSACRSRPIPANVNQYPNIHYPPDVWGFCECVMQLDYVAMSQGIDDSRLLICRKAPTNIELRHTQTVHECRQGQALARQPH